MNYFMLMLGCSNLACSVHGVVSKGAPFQIAFNFGIGLFIILQVFLPK